MNGTLEKKMPSEQWAEMRAWAKQEWLRALPSDRAYMAFSLMRLLDAQHDIGRANPQLGAELWASCEKLAAKIRGLSSPRCDGPCPAPGPAPG
jgi:hypothetical protein